MADHRVTRAESSHIDDQPTLPGIYSDPSLSYVGLTRGSTASYASNKPNPMFRGSDIELTKSFSPTGASSLDAVKGQASRPNDWTAMWAVPGYAARVDRYACAFALAGGLVGAGSGLYLAETLPGVAMESEQERADNDFTLTSMGFAAGLLLSGALAVLALPLTRPSSRRLAEGMVLLSMVCGTAQLYLFMFYFKVSGGAVMWTEAVGFSYNVTLLTFELFGTMPFLALLWGHTNWPVMRLLWSQVRNTKGELFKRAATLPPRSDAVQNPPSFFLSGVLPTGAVQGRVRSGALVHGGDGVGLDARGPRPAYVLACACGLHSLAAGHGARAGRPRGAVQNFPPRRAQPLHSIRILAGLLLRLRPESDPPGEYGPPTELPGRQRRRWWCRAVASCDQLGRVPSILSADDHRAPHGSLPL